ncbi:MAG: hypothetical protein J0I07_26695 [Myxococcales bacterium]|nr:hypothetical protein [Myxococcales bacterium]
MKRQIFALLFSLGTITALAAGCSAEAVDEDTATEDDELRRFRPNGENGGETLPTQTSINGFYIGGYEYWPYKEAQPLYPEKIQWGFSAGSDPARLCMAEATRALAKILENPPKSLVELREKHRISSFFNWNNDYTGARRDGMASHRSLWLYNKTLIKWISETNGNGSCLIPSRADLDRFAKACIDDYPNCY